MTLQSADRRPEIHRLFPNRIALLHTTHKIRSINWVGSPLQKLELPCWGFVFRSQMCLHPDCQTDPHSPFCSDVLEENFPGQFFCPKFIPARFVLLWVQPAVKGLQWHFTDCVCKKSHPVSSGCSSLNQKEFCTFIDDSVTLEYREKEQSLYCCLISVVCFLFTF